MTSTNLTRSHLQIFENARSDSENGSQDNVDAEEIRRLSMNRSSIAERRRLYESRTMTDEKPPQSPLPTLYVTFSIFRTLQM